MSGIDILLEKNRTHSEAFISPDASLARKQYLAKHPTAISALKCMDGRLNLSFITDTQPGIIQPWRNLGGQFNLGWPYFGELMGSWVERSVSRGVDCLVLITYHFSKGEPYRGCKGFGYDTAKAQAHTLFLKGQFEHCFGHQHSAVYPIQVGVETDEDALIIHGSTGEALDLSQVEGSVDLEAAVRRLFPDMKDRFVLDLVPLLEGNIRHVASVRSKGRPLQDIDHKEWVLAIGRGFDWLHELNTALIVGPFSPDLTGPIKIAANLLMDNVKSGRLSPSQELVLMSSSLSRNGSRGPHWIQAQQKADFLAGFALDIIRNEVPELAERICPLVGVVDMQTHQFVRQEF